MGYTDTTLRAVRAALNIIDTITRSGTYGTGNPVPVGVVLHQLQREYYFPRTTCRRALDIARELGAVEITLQPDPKGDQRLKYVYLTTTGQHIVNGTFTGDLNTFIP